MCVSSVLICYFDSKIFELCTFSNGLLNVFMLWGLSCILMVSHEGVSVFWTSSHGVMIVLISIPELFVGG